MTRQLNDPYTHRSHTYNNARITIPSSTPQSLVFPYDSKALKFDTSSYDLAQTQGRVTLKEIEEFLKDVNAPFRAYDEKYSPHEGLARDCLALLFLVLFPLFPFFLCFLCYRTGQMAKDWRIAKDKALELIKSKDTSFTERGLMWNIPEHFPLWIELRTISGDYEQLFQLPQPMQVNQEFQTVPSYQSTTGIDLQTVTQQNYQQSSYPNNQNNFAPSNRV